jgi:cyclic-di-GMP phosphodiesterase TipF (flagellum assembly factor)
MSYLSHALIAGTYAMAALGLGAVLYMAAGVAPEWAAVAGFAFLVIGAQAHGAVARWLAARAIDAEIEALRRANDILTGELDSARRKMREVAQSFEDAAQARSERLVSEMRVLEGLIQRLAQPAPVEETSAPTPASPPQDAGYDIPPAGPRPDAAVWTPPAGGDSVAAAELLASVRSALEENRVDLYLQPIVSLPQRKLRFYEGFTRLRGEDGEMIMPGQYLAVAESGGLMPVIDNLLLFRCVQIVRRLIQRSRDVGVICNLSAHSLEDKTFFPQFLEFMEYNVDLAPKLIFEFGQATLDGCGPYELGNLERLAELGFPFSMDKVTSLDLDPRYLRNRNVRFVKVPASQLLTWVEEAGEPGPVLAFKRRLGAYGLDLIAEKIEDEATVTEVLDVDPDYGQGYHFGTPRPLREEVLGEMAMTG